MSKASMTCRCGNVQIEFTDSSPRVSTECCCNHCFARVRYLEELGGPAVSTKPLLNSKWDDRVNIVRGREFLFGYKLTPRTQVTNIATTCCNTFMLGRHSVYDGNCVTTASDFPVWRNTDLPFMASSRWFSNQWGPDRLAQYPPFMGIWVKEEDGSITGETGWEEVFAKHMESMQREIRQDAVGETFDNILDSIGRGSIIFVSETSK